jgi:hypothetical protein
VHAALGVSVVGENDDTPVDETGVPEENLGKDSDANRSVHCGDEDIGVDQVLGGRLRMYTAEAIMNRPDPTYLVDQMLAMGETGGMYGDANIGKTFVGLDLAASVATGTDFLGRSVVQGAVIYVAAEGIGGIGKRLRAWMQARGIDRLDNLYVIPDTVDLLDAGLVNNVISLATRVHAQLIVFDTLALSMPGADESGAKDMGLAVASVNRVREQTGSAVFLIHHTVKRGQAERGSGALRGALDTMFNLQRDRSTNNLMLVCDKQRNFEPPLPVSFRLEHVGDSLVPAPLASAPWGWTPPSADTENKKVIARIEAVLSGEAKAGRTPLTQNKVLMLVKGNAATVTRILQDHANDPSTKVTMTVSGNARLYDWMG